MVQSLTKYDREKGNDLMFSNIGRKVRGLAAVLCVIGILAAVGAGVFLYFTKLLELVPCIAIAVGGVLISWLSSWVMYCIGDTHVKIERLEEKLIPKPAYAEYLTGSGSARGTCEICGRTTDLISAKISDQLGTRYRKVCRECFAVNHCEEAD